MKNAFFRALGVRAWPAGGTAITDAISAVFCRFHLFPCHFNQADWTMEYDDKSYHTFKASGQQFEVSNDLISPLFRPTLVFNCPYLLPLT